MTGKKLLSSITDMCYPFLVCPPKKENFHVLKNVCTQSTKECVSDDVKNHSSDSQVTVKIFYL